jgi:hypothetical protein
VDAPQAHGYGGGLGGVRGGARHEWHEDEPSPANHGRRHILSKELSKRLMGGGFANTTAIPNNPRAYATGSSPSQALEAGRRGGHQHHPTAALGPSERLRNMEVLFRFMAARQVLPLPPAAGGSIDDGDNLYADDEVGWRCCPFALFSSCPLSSFSSSY